MALSSQRYRHDDQVIITANKIHTSIGIAYLGTHRLILIEMRLCYISHNGLDGVIDVRSQVPSGSKWEVPGYAYAISKVGERSGNSARLVTRYRILKIRLHRMQSCIVVISEQRLADRSECSICVRLRFFISFGVWISKLSSKGLPRISTSFRATSGSKSSNSFSVRC